MTEETRKLLQIFICRNQKQQWWYLQFQKGQLCVSHFWFNPTRVEEVLAWKLMQCLIANIVIVPPFVLARVVESTFFTREGVSASTRENALSLRSAPSPWWQLTIHPTSGGRYPSLECVKGFMWVRWLTCVLLRLYIYNHRILSNLFNVVTYTIVQWREPSSTHQRPQHVVIWFQGTAEKFLSIGPDFESW